MNIDERGRRAATDLLERAAARTVPTIDELDVPAPRRQRVLMFVGAAAVVLLAVLGFVATRVDHRVRTIASLPTPSGVQAKAWSPAGLGVSMAVPSRWQEGGATSGYRFSIGEPSRDAYVLADRL